MGFLEDMRSTGAYERRIFLLLIILGPSVNWTKVGVLVIFPDVDFRTNATLTNDCDSVENSSAAFIFDHSQYDYTATEKYSLICGREWLRNMAKTILVLGYFFAFGAGVVSDRYGRRPVLLAAPVISVLVNISSIYAPNIEIYLLLRFVQGVIGCTLITTSVILSTECLPPQTRYMASLFNNFAFEFTKVLVGASSYFIKDFRYHHVWNTCQFVILFLMTYFFTFESPRWLAATNEQTKCEKIIEKIVQVNHADPEDYSFLKTVIHNQQRQSQFIDILRTTVIRRRTLIMFVFWSSAAFSMYAILLNLNSFTHDVRLGLTIMGIITSPAISALTYAANLVGRQVGMFILLLVSVAVLFAMVPFAHDKTSPVLMTLALSGGVAVGGFYAINFMYTQEVYPTVIRQTGLGACMTVSRLSVLIAPQISLLNAYWPPATAVILGSVVALALLLVPALPDTTGEELAQTIDEGEQFLKHHRYSLVLPNRRQSQSPEAPTTEEESKLNSTTEEESKLNSNNNHA